MRVLITVVTGVMLLSLPALVAEGQGGRGAWRGWRPPMQQQPQATTVDGTIDKVEKGMILVTTGASSGGKKNSGQNNQQRQTQAPAGQQWLVSTGPGTKIKVNGTANPDYLHVGLYIDFKAQYDGDTNTIRDMVTELTVLSYSADRPPGLYPGGAGLHRIHSPTDGGQGGGQAKHGKKNAKGADPKGGNDVAGSGMYEIIGRVTSYKDNKMTVLAKKGEQALTVELGAFPKITVALSDLSVVKRGDKITAKGKRAGMQMDCMASEVIVTLSEPLSGKKRPAAAKSETTKPDTAETEDTKPKVHAPAAKAEDDGGDKAEDK